jgi:regulator of cell morphogenesis and NO signaling
VWLQGELPRVVAPGAHEKWNFKQQCWEIAMSLTDLDISVGQLVIDRPGRSRVFEALGIDYCCGGKKPLAQACREKGLDPKTVAQVLDLADAGPAQEERDWSASTLTELADHIENTHHEYLKKELPRVSMLIQRVVAAHGFHRPELLEVQETFGAFANELELHMMKEEGVLFPAIRRIEAGDGHGDCQCGDLAAPIRAMEHEHDDAGQALEKLRSLTNGFVPPVGACNTYRSMLSALEEMEKDMHRHVHKENSILFPRALATDRTQ